MSRILAISLVGVENLEKLAWIARISLDSYRGWANCADFAQFAVDFASSIFLRAKRKMVGEFRLICPKRWLFVNFGGCTWIFNLVLTRIAWISRHS